MESTFTVLDVQECLRGLLATLPLPGLLAAMKMFTRDQFPLRLEERHECSMVIIDALVHQSLMFVLLTSRLDRQPWMPR